MSTNPTDRTIDKNSMISNVVSTIVLEHMSSPVDIEQDTLYFELKHGDKLNGPIPNLMKICDILDMKKVDEYMKKLESGQLDAVFNPVLEFDEPLTQAKYLSFLTGYDNTTPTQMSYSTQNVWWLNKYGEEQLKALIEAGAEIEYKGKKFTKDSGNLDELKYEYIIDLNNPVYGWLYSVYENMPDLIKKNEEAIRKVIKMKMVNGEPRYINSSILNNNQIDFLNLYGTVLADKYTLGGFNDMYLSEDSCESILNRVLGHKGYTMVTSPIMVVKFPRGKNQTMIGEWDYNFKIKTKEVNVNDKGEIVKPSKPVAASKVQGKPVAQQKGIQQKGRPAPVKEGNADITSVQTGTHVETRAFMYDEFKVIRGFYLDVLGNFKIGQLVVAPSFLDSKAMSTADELLKKNLMKSVWPVFNSITTQKGMYAQYLSRQKEIEKSMGRKYKDLGNVAITRTIPVEQIAEEEERKRISGGEMKVAMIEGKRGDMERVDMAEKGVEPARSKEGQEDVQEVQNVLPIQQQEDQTNGEQETQVENELEDMFDAV